MAKYRKMLSNTNAAVIQSLMALIETQSKATLITWTTDYAEVHLLPVYAKDSPNDPRPE